eukprot:CAMPEP_0177784686 /NCGR_PEP_ID=MMETSP0491_2-20121128/19864_1 /TAXON_ID=63592 /ORGANISM="Tetraselmis chuii, Strain PLY429" /LENGTH=426 /DNA_ID=CAMNT_0019305531 /DNA_START=336 /DNA_END=1616 /DNA_ORIENTATION=+
MEGTEPSCSDLYGLTDEMALDELESFSDEEEVGEDTTAEQVKQGTDIQGIPWERLRLSRENYRRERLNNYKAHANEDVPVASVDKDAAPVQTGNTFFEFSRNSRSVRSSIVHFQLRNLLSATSNHDVYVNFRNCITHYSTLTRKTTPVLDLSGATSGGSAPGLGNVQVCTQAIKDGLLVVGGFYGELVAKNLCSEDDNVTFSRRVTDNINGITNAVEIFHPVTGGPRIMTSNNDAKVRVIDAESFKTVGDFGFPWAVNYATASPTHPHLMCVVGDDAEAVLADSDSGKVAATLRGHLHYSFAAAWHPDGRVFATGSQDMSTRLWDLRYLKRSFGTLMGQIGAVRSLRYSSDGRFLAVAEPADFVHLYDVASDYRQCQEVDMFGEISGCCFSPDSDVLFTSIADATYSSLLQFKQSRGHRAFDHFVC